LRFPLGLVPLTNDQFSKDVFISKVTDTHFAFIADVVVSPVLFAWLFQLNTHEEIISPVILGNHYPQYCQKIIDLYLKN